MKTHRAATLLILALALSGTAVSQEKKKNLLVIGMSAGFQHDSVSDALGTLYMLGRDTGVWSAWLRTDVQWITKKKLPGNARNLDFFDAVFFMTTGELPLDESQKADLLAFVHEDGKGFLGAHNATDTFYKWPEYGAMIGGYFDGHPWNQFLATINVVDRDFPATRHFPSSFQVTDEIYQTKEFPKDRVRVLMELDMANVDMKAKGVKGSYVPIAWASEYGRGRVFYCGLGHRTEVWERKDIRQMWIEAIKWTMGLTQASAKPR